MRNTNQKYNNKVKQMADCEGAELR